MSDFEDKKFIFDDAEKSSKGDQIVDKAIVPELVERFLTSRKSVAIFFSFVRK